MGAPSQRGESGKNALLRSLPSIEQLLRRPALESRLAAIPRARAVAALRLAVERVRGRLLRGEARPFEDADVDEALRSLLTPRLRAVLNATGVVLHTNLGRAPLAPEAVARVAAVARGYSNLEYDLEEGERGTRYAPVAGLLTELTGAEDALVVNNGAGAALLVLAALAAGKECVLSRGELVEIGGGFRVPEVMRQSGARLVEVGTTNRTRRSDYEGALTPETGLLVKVHRSNFEMVGFTEEVAVAELAALGRARGVPVFQDLGSGLLVPLKGDGLTAEPSVRHAVTAGVDVVAFSGDKLLGGPQAGIIVGRHALLSRIKAHPLTRALRVDKMTVAALEATLELYRDGRPEAVPTWRLLAQPSEVLRARAERLRGLLAAQGVTVRVAEVSGQVGGGAMPLARLPSFACILTVQEPEGFLESLRGAEVPVIGRIADGEVLLDVRCLAEDELGRVAEAVGGTAGQERGP
ncbi:L-seryl-tRNA(Sec) selenium transferase [Stigmatella aurantiaca]|uniref:L-seryl-tRNA(Sec) selenium transferase n=1 Tax=Stigmatella aurantiaca (strain DW4/3-1) TaxID=378806 RepID=Q08RA4_STIAD|nr:L-seryl-tRNA(Sec) selenium transferase [Stigmatella aurantiaca]ADO71597.1 L-seryl-tRNA selenium transferase [Stigmatella aurantiaca DW4/3-1]EAU63026.1 L-seryl-tRNA selenium transferase [Stigmatella aurantiaca DW4/3-1]